MVFIIQNTQNRDNLAVQIKLDELLKNSKHTKESLINIEDESDAALERKKKAE